MVLTRDQAFGFLMFSEPPTLAATRPFQESTMRRLLFLAESYKLGYEPPGPSEVGRARRYSREVWHKLGGRHGQMLEHLRRSIELRELGQFQTKVCTHGRQAAHERKHCNWQAPPLARAEPWRQRPHRRQPLQDSTMRSSDFDLSSNAYTTVHLMSKPAHYTACLPVPGSISRPRPWEGHVSQGSSTRPLTALARARYVMRPAASAGRRARIRS
jgi:hypothetical protein